MQIGTYIRTHFVKAFEEKTRNMTMAFRNFMSSTLRRNFYSVINIVDKKFREINFFDKKLMNQTLG